MRKLLACFLRLLIVLLSPIYLILAMAVFLIQPFEHLIVYIFMYIKDGDDYYDYKTLYEKFSEITENLIYNINQIEKR